MAKSETTSPATREDALRIARDLVRDADTLVPYPHEKLEHSRYGRGFAFLQTIRSERGDLDAYVLVSEGGTGSGLLSDAGRTIDMVIDEHLERHAQANRDIADSELTPAHLLALEAYDTGLDRIARLPAREGIDPATADDADYADFVLLILRRGRNSGLSGRKLLARNDFLLEAPDQGRRYTQPCPVCDRPAPYEPRYPGAVCDHCRERTTDRAGRRVTGFNTHLSGGMICYYTDTLDRPEGSASGPEECVEITRTGMCFIDGHPAIMEEARFGGIVIQAAPPRP